MVRRGEISCKRKRGKTRTSAHGNIQGGGGFDREESEGCSKSSKSMGLEKISEDGENYAYLGVASIFPFFEGGGGVGGKRGAAVSYFSNHSGKTLGSASALQILVFPVYHHVVERSVVAGEAQGS